MSNLVKWDPFAELSALQKQFFGDDWMSPLKGVNIPTTDVFTKDNNLVVEAHLPNFEQAIKIVMGCSRVGLSQYILTAIP